MQHHLIVCPDRHEYLDPYRFGDGRRLSELGRPGSFVLCALAWLLAGDSGRGTGDLPAHPMVGRWAGRRVVIAGDYGEPGEHLPDGWRERWAEGQPGPGEPEPPSLFTYIQAFGLDVSAAAAEMLSCEPALVSLAQREHRELVPTGRCRVAELALLGSPAPSAADLSDTSMFDFGTGEPDR